MAKARLKERHQQFLKKKLNELKLEVGIVCFIVTSFSFFTLNTITSSS